MITAIQELLETTGRAIIPDVGCLSKGDDNQIVFNSFLKFNDGKLVEQVMKNENLDENQATEKVMSWAKDVQNQVLAGSDFYLGELGRFFLEGKDDLGFDREKVGAVEKVERVERVEEVEIVEDIEKEEIAEDITSSEVDENPDETLESEDESVKNVDDFPQLKNVYTPPIEEENNTSLDDILKKTSNPENEREAAAEESVPNEEKVAWIESVEAHDEEEVIVPEIAAEQTTSSEKSSEEITVTRKRSPFFYINIVLLILIVGLGAFAFMYADEVSEWLGISSPKTENVKDSLPEQEQNAAENFETDSISEIEDATDSASQEPSFEQEIPVAPEVTELEKPKEVIQPIPDPMPSNNIPAVASGGDFHIIVGKFAIKENADRLVQKIRNAGYDGKILRSTSTGHTVSFHTYPTLQDASNAVSKAKDITGTGAYVEHKK